MRSDCETAREVTRSYKIQRKYDFKLVPNVRIIGELMSDTQKPTLRRQLGSVLVEIIAATFWIYAVAKLFLFDIDNMIAHSLIPQYEWMLQLKVLAFLIAISIALFLVGKTNVALSSLFILFYPIVIILWKIPYFIWKQKSWIIAFSFLNAIRDGIYGRAACL
jgi:hypothetical protein